MMPQSIYRLRTDRIKHHSVSPAVHYVHLADIIRICVCGCVCHAETRYRSTAAWVGVVHHLVTSSTVSTLMIQHTAGLHHLRRHQQSSMTAVTFCSKIHRSLAPTTAVQAPQVGYCAHLISSASYFYLYFLYDFEFVTFSFSYHFVATCRYSW